METVTTLSDETIEGIQDLIQINIDSFKGFSKAADNIENAAVATFFRQCGERRSIFATQLQGAVSVNDEEPEDSGGIPGKLHRWWIDIRGTVQDGDEHAILAEAERGEDMIKEKYESVLKNTAGSPLNAILHEQYASVKKDHDTIRDLRDARA